VSAIKKTGIGGERMKRVNADEAAMQDQPVRGDPPEKVILVIYATREGQTLRIAQRVAAHAQAAGFATDTIDAVKIPPGFSLERYCAAIVAASVHCGRHEREIVGFVRSHAKELNGMITAFLSVSLSEANYEDRKAPDAQRSRASADVRNMIDAFLSATGWTPGRILPVAGAVPFTKYNFPLRLLMQRISRRAGGATDTSRDYEYTDWKTLGAFVHEFIRGLGEPRARSHETSIELRASPSQPASRAGLPESGWR
jgi:menaquinone-dependent protoporphyrinogen oxidase